ncbi:MAG: phytoene/squalene synthase family protein [Candidatus Omnitrophica bacterium]|nr:phytoene/squalene synthase family protein [Candidatus Omnitrophota bacterium]
MKKQNGLVRSGFARAKEITRKYAKTYYFASLFLPKAKRDAAYAAYAICRIGDESVDNSPRAEVADNLIKLKSSIELVYSGAELNDSLLLAFQEAVFKYQIPKEYFAQVIEGMYMDLTISRYKNFQELYTYCYRVAGVVGLIMLKIFGYSDKRAEVYAVNLGIAMQLTNITRDIKEDYLRGRIYLPQDEMARYGISEKQISEGKQDENFKALLKFQIRRAREYYADSQLGINMIGGSRSRFVAYAIKDIYANILDAIEKNNYDIFSKRARVNTIEKICIALKIFLKREFICE